MTNLYQAEGYNSRREYLAGLAEDHNVPLEVVLSLASLLGPSEDFDGLVIAVEDAEGCFDDEEDAHAKE